MAGISAQVVLKMIMANIGGIPLVGAMSTIVSGSPPAQQVGFGSLMSSIPGASMLSGVLAGGSPESMLSGVFQNPVAGITDSINGQITTTMGALTTAFQNQTIDLSQLNSLASGITGQTFAGTFDNLTSNDIVGGLSASIPDLKDLTNKMSGLAVPDFAGVGDIGFSQITSLTTTFENLKDRIPTSMESVYGLKDAIDSNLAKITAPLDIGTNLASLPTTLQTIATKATAGTLNNTLIAQYTGIVDTAHGLVTTSTTDARNTVNQFTSGSTALSYVSQAQAVLNNPTTAANSFLSKVVQTTPLAQIQATANLPSRIEQNIIT